MPHDAPFPTLIRAYGLRRRCTIQNDGLRSQFPFARHGLYPTRGICRCAFEESRLLDYGVHSFLDKRTNQENHGGEEKG